MNTYALAASLFVLFLALANATIRAEINYHRSSPHWLWVTLPPLVLAVGCLVAAAVWRWQTVPWEIAVVFGAVWLLVMLPLHLHLQSIMLCRHTPITGLMISVSLFLLLHKAAEFLASANTDQLPWPITLFFLIVCSGLSWQINRRLDTRFSRPEMIM